MKLLGVFKTKFTREPGRGDTFNLSNLNETLPDLGENQTTLKDKVGRLYDFFPGELDHPSSILPQIPKLH